MKNGNNSRNMKIDKIPTLGKIIIKNHCIDYSYITYDYQKFTKTRHDIIKTYEVLMKNQDKIVL